MLRRVFQVLAAVVIVLGGIAFAASSAAEPRPDGAGVVLQSTLTGSREIGPDGSPGAGDLDGVGAGAVVVYDDHLCFLLNSSSVELPATAAHIHRAPIGANGPIVVTLTPPGGDGRSGGCVEQVSGALLAEIARDPGNFYLNVHTASFPNGAVRGQLNEAAKEGALTAARLTGFEEIGPQGEPGAGDPTGRGVATVAVSVADRRVCLEISVEGVLLPAVGAHIHEGVIGVNGPIVITLPAPHADGRSQGCVRGLDPGLLQRLAASPADFYVNVHTSEFPNGAVRGQLAPAGAFGGDTSPAAPPRGLR